MGTRSSEDPDRRPLAPTTRPHPARCCPARPLLLVLPGVLRVALSLCLSHCTPCHSSSRRPPPPRPRSLLQPFLRRRLLHSPPPPATSVVQPCATLCSAAPIVSEHAAAIRDTPAAARCARVPVGTTRSKTRPRPLLPIPNGFPPPPTPPSPASAPSRDGFCDDVAESPYCAACPPL